VKKFTVIAFVLVVGLAALLILASPTSGKMDLKVGDSVYACNCGTSCPCQTISTKPGKCHCGSDLAAATVVKVGETTADLKFGEETRTFSRVGKYTCGCGESCTCKTISQSPGKCGCGKDLIEADEG